MKKSFFILIFLIPMILFALSISDSRECYSCQDCNTKIDQAGNGETITLEQDVLNGPIDCLSFAGHQNLVFDCKNHQIIASQRTGTIGGVSLYQSRNILIKNCVFKNFIKAIDLCNTNDSRIENFTATDNNFGIYFCGSGYRNDIINSNFSFNDYYGILFGYNIYGNLNFENNKICNNPGGDIKNLSGNSRLPDLSVSNNYCDQSNVPGFCQHPCGYVPPYCGNNLIETPEVCDGTNLNGKTCLDFGYAGGTLSCFSNCLEYVFQNCRSIQRECDSAKINNIDYFCSDVSDDICPEDFFDPVHFIRPNCSSGPLQCRDPDCQGQNPNQPPGQFQLTIPMNESDFPNVQVPILFKWLQSSNAQNYTFIIDNDSNFGTPVSSNPGLLTNSFSLPGNILEGNKKYFWTVKAFNPYGQTSASNYPFVLTTGVIPQQSNCNITSASIDTALCTDNGRCRTGDKIKMNITVENISKCLNINKMMIELGDDAIVPCMPKLKNDPRVVPRIIGNSSIGDWTVIVLKECVGRTVTLNRAHLFNTSGTIGFKIGSFGTFSFSFEPTPYLLESIDVQPATISLNVSYPGNNNPDSQQLTANATFRWQSNLSRFYKDVTYDSNTVYSSNNTSVATVTPTGLVKAGTTIGDAKITAMHYYLSEPKEDFSIAFVRFRTGPWVKYVHLFLKRYFINIADTTEYNVTGVLSNGTSINITGQSSVASRDNSIAKVISGFRINGTGVGSTFIEANYSVSQNEKLTDLKLITVQGQGSGCVCGQTQCNQCETSFPYRYCKNISNQGQWVNDCREHPNQPNGCCGSGYGCNTTGSCQQTGTTKSCNQKTSFTSCNTTTLWYCYWDFPVGLPENETAYCKHCYMNDQGPETCSDYHNATSCNLDRCSVSSYGCPPNADCSCSWNSGRCIQRIQDRRVGPNGEELCCLYNVSYGTCSEGCDGQENSRKKITSCTGPCDPSKPSQCSVPTNCSLTYPGASSTECLACAFRTEKFPFFMPWQILIVLALLSLYYILVILKSRKEKNLKNN